MRSRGACSSVPISGAASLPRRWRHSSRCWAGSKKTRRCLRSRARSICATASPRKRRSISPRRSRSIRKAPVDVWVLRSAISPRARRTPHSRNSRARRPRVRGRKRIWCLIRLALARREFDKALAAIDAAEKKQPNTPLARYLRGLALVGKRDIAGARKSFEQALAVDAAFVPAAANLARLDLADKKPEDAKKRFDAVLAKDPKNAAALLALAELRARSGGSPDEVAALIEKAIAANPTAVLPRRVLISHRLRTNDAKKAVAAGQDALSALPDRPEIVQALARAQLAAGETSQALASYNKLIQLQPNSPVPLVLRADAQVAAKDNEAALQSLRKALAPEIGHDRGSARDRDAGTRRRGARRRLWRWRVKCRSSVPRSPSATCSKGMPMPKRSPGTRLPPPTVQGSSRPVRSISP